MSDYQHLPNAREDRTYWMLQGIVENADGTHIRPTRPVTKPEEVPIGHEEILKFLMYGEVGGRHLLKAWIETITVSTTSTVRELNIS